MVAAVPEVQRLEGELQQCVAALQFEAAATLRDRLKMLKTQLAAGEAEVKRLEAELQQHVEALEFETAAELRDRIKALRSSLGVPSGAAGGTPVEKDGQQPTEKKSRTVLVARLPLKTEMSELRARFPKAVDIQLLKGPMYARCLVEFPTVAEAEAVAGGVAHSRTLGQSVQSEREEEEARTVFISRLPLATTEAELRQHFPAAVRITVRRGKAVSFAFVVFRTAAAAEAAAAGTILVGGKPTAVAMAGDREDKAAMENRRKEEASRTVFLACMPQKTTQTDLSQCFPDAEDVAVIPGKRHASGFVVFATTDAAQRVASQAQMEVAGGSAFVCMAGERATIDAAVRSYLRQEEDSRTVYVSGLPLALTEEELQQHFSTAERITARQGKYHAYAFVVFNTVAEAETQVATGTIEIGGKTATLRIASDKEAVMKHRQDCERRTVFVARLPLTASEAELRQCFFTAESAEVFPGKQQATAMVRFPTAEEAQSIASQSHTQFAGKPVFVCMAGDSQAIEKDKEEARSRSVFLSTLPLTTSQADLQQRFPTAEAVKLMCGQFRATALIRFPTVEEAEGVAALAHVELGGQSILVCMAGRTGSAECRTVYLARLSPSATQADLEQTFPTAESTRLVCKGSRTIAFVTFPDVEEALAVAQQAEVVVAGRTTAVWMDDANRGQKRAMTDTPRGPKRSKLSPIGI